MNVKVIQSLRFQIESMKKEIFNKQVILESLESKLKDELKEVQNETNN